MAEVLLSSDDLTVLGGPAEIQLDTNVGPSGNRGVFVFFGLPNPNSESAVFSETPIVFDLYIVVDSSSDDYLAVYQYNVQDGIPQWTFRIRLRPNFFGTNKIATFSSGVATININSEELGLIVAPSFLDTRFQYSVQATLSNYDLDSEYDPGASSAHFPAAVSVQVGDLFLDPSDSETKLPITLHAAEFNGTSLVPIDNKKVVAHLSILLVSPTEVLNYIEAEGA